jgi:hypothetical protein
VLPARAPQRFSRIAALLLAPLLLGGALGGCGGGGDSGGGGGGPPLPGCSNGGGPTLTVTGSIGYERMTVSPVNGLSGTLVTLPVRFADIRIRAAGGGTCYGEASTDASGSYSITANPPANAQVEIAVLSLCNADPLRNVTVHNALPPGVNAHADADVFVFASPAFAATGSPSVGFTVPYNPSSTSSRPSIGFAVLDVLLTCSEAIRTGTGQIPPQCHAYTRLGNAGSTGTSFFDSGAQALTLLGGAAGALDTSDTDYFDDGVIAHEYGHFVEFAMSTTRNRGGAHAGEQLEPPFSWSEGAATGFGCLLRNSPLYVDTVRTSPFPPQISSNAENWTPQLVRGIGGEETVTEIVWDLVDGQGGVPDSDSDAVATPFGPLYAQFLGYNPATTAPYIGTLLDRCVNALSVPQGNVTTLMGAPENQQISYPLTGNDVWPLPLAVPGMASGSANSLAGANKNQCRGLPSSVWYTFTQGAAGQRTFTLTIGATAGNGDNLDLFLENPAGGVFAQSTNGGATTETIGPINLAPGVYIVRVEADCAGAGNQATFTLTVN